MREEDKDGGTGEMRTRMGWKKGWRYGKKIRMETKHVENVEGRKGRILE